MEEIAQTHENFIFQKYEPIIIIALNKEKQSVTILDNGSGMNIEILKKYFLNVGVSYYNSDAGISEIESFIEKNFLDCGVSMRIFIQEKNQQESFICRLKRAEDILTEKICLNQYLDGIEAYVECNYKGLNFAKTIKDLNGNKSYYYN